VKTAAFDQGNDKGSFTVPAYATAVFVKPQGDSQGAGLATDPNLVPVPKGDTEIFLRGINTWDAVNLMQYDGEGIYSFSTSLTTGQYSFKIADANWQEVNLGYNEVAVADDSIALTADDGNLSVELTQFAGYQFSVDASAPTPVVKVEVANQIIACDALPDSADAYPFEVAGGGKLYVRDSHSSWGADALYEFAYKGKNRYQAVAQFDGDIQFKLASDDDNWTTQLFATNEAGTGIETANLSLDTAHTVALGNAGTDNNQASLAAGTYSFLLTLDEANPSASMDVGALVVQQCSVE
jgi:pullulanase